MAISYAVQTDRSRCTYAHWAIPTYIRAVFFCIVQMYDVYTLLANQHRTMAHSDDDDWEPTDAEDDDDDGDYDYDYAEDIAEVGAAMSSLLLLLLLLLQNPAV